MPIKHESREYRKIDAATMETRKAEDGAMIVEGYATTYNQPYQLWRDKDMTVNEQVDPNAFAETDMSDVIMQYDHEGRVFARISNGTLELESDDHGLKIRANLGGTEIGRQLFEEIHAAEERERAERAEEERRSAALKKLKNLIEEVKQDEV